MFAEFLTDAFPFLYYGGFIALGILVALKTHIHTQAVLTLVTTGASALSVMWIKGLPPGDEVDLASALGVLFLVVFPCVIFTPVMWLTTSTKMLYGYLKSMYGTRL